MSDDNKSSDIRDSFKVLGIIAAVLAGIGIIACVVISMLPTVGGSFGFGFPSGSGGRAIRDVEIDVEPQVVYRIDDHRFFTLEKYLNCSFGGFVYYNDTNKKIKVLAGYDGEDKRPQNEFTISQPNGVMDFHSKFIYAASDNIIAYPGSNVSYKYGFLNYFIVLKNINDPLKNAGFVILGSSSDTITITDNAIYIQDNPIPKNYEKYSIPKESDDYEWIDASDAHFNRVSQDDHFHCDNTIKPRRVKYISD